MTPAAEIADYQLEVARRWIDEATALADRPEVELVAPFSAFDAIRRLAAVNREAA